MHSIALLKKDYTFTEEELNLIFNRIIDTNTYG